MEARDSGVVGNMVRHGEDYVLTAPYGTMRVKYNHYDMGYKGVMQYLSRETGRWIIAGYYADDPALMAAYYREINERRIGS